HRGAVGTVYSLRTGAPQAVLLSGRYQAPPAVTRPNHGESCGVIYFARSTLFGVNKMGVSYQTGTLVRTGEERATLVRRTYGLVFVSVLVTMVGVSYGLSQPRLMGAVVAHPFLAFFCSIAPLLMAT